MSDNLSAQSKIFIAGHRGLVGSALVRIFREAGFQNLILKNRDEVDLEDRPSVQRLMRQERPDLVILAAAKVGGIAANSRLPFDFVSRNLKIQENVIEESHQQGVQRLVFLGSSCIYPRMAPQPIKEEYLMSGPLEFTNRSYALAKIAGIELCWAINRQFGRKYFAVMPTNIYGVEDNFDLETSHVLPALMRKFHTAKVEGKDSVEVWGTGTPRREFLFNDDLARAILFLLMNEAKVEKLLFADSENPPMLNVGYGSDVTIAELSNLVKKTVGFQGEILFNSGRPDGTPRKLMDSSKLFRLGWVPAISLVDGIKCVYERRFGGGLGL